MTEAPGGTRSLVAYRAWAFSPPAKDPILKSLNNFMPWAPDRWTRAQCLFPRANGVPHTAPLERCSCGIYAAKTMALPVMLAQQQAQALVGRVELAGKIIEHDDGYRAEFARVVELLPAPGQESAAEWIASVYGARVSLDLINLWGSFPHSRSEPCPEPAGTFPKGSRSRSHDEGQASSASARARRTLASRLGGALIGLAMLGSLQLTLGSLATPSPAPASTSTASVVTAQPPTGVTLTCTNANPLNCHPPFSPYLQALLNARPLAQRTPPQREDAPPRRLSRAT